MFDNTKINEKEAEERPSRKKVEKRPKKRPRMRHFKTSLRRRKEEEALFLFPHPKMKHNLRKLMFYESRRISLFLWRTLAKGREREREREGEKKM